MGAYGVVDRELDELCAWEDAHGQTGDDGDEVAHGAVGGRNGGILVHCGEDGGREGASVLRQSVFALSLSLWNWDSNWNRVNILCHHHQRPGIESQLPPQCRKFPRRLLLF